MRVTRREKSIFFIKIKNQFLAYGTEMWLPRNNAFKNSLLVPYQAPLKFGLSANKITLPFPMGLTNKQADGFK